MKKNSGLWVLFCGTVLAGCSGGGSSIGSTAPIRPAATPGGMTVGIGGVASSPGPSSSPGTGANTYNVQSIPAGLAVQAPSFTGRTNTTVPIFFSDSAQTIAIVPSNGAPNYTYGASQNYSGHTFTIFYNQNADTSGGISIKTTASVLPPGSSPLRTRMFKNLSDRPVYSPSVLSVSYRASVLARRHAGAVERSVGIAHGLDLGPVQNGVQSRVVQVPAARQIDELMEQLLRQPEVVDVQRVHMRYLLGSVPQTPNDPAYAGRNLGPQWDLIVSQFPYAWGYTESGTPIAIVDTGVDSTHPDLAGNVSIEEQILNGTVSGPAPLAARDTDGHGTHVAGIAAALTNNGIGFAGAAWSARIQAYKVFPDPQAPCYDQCSSYGANSADIAAAIYDAVKNGAKVINLSLGGDAAQGVDPSEQTAINFALASGVVVVAAAGNGDASNRAQPQLNFPAGYAGVVSVGASGVDDGSSPGQLPPISPETIASYSNYGPSLTVVAPGGTALDPSDSDNLHWIGNAASTQTTVPPPYGAAPVACPACYQDADGTSEAAPHVAGLVALMLAKNSSLSPAQVLTILENTADDICSTDPLAISENCPAAEGHGRVDAYRALAAAAGDAAPPTPAPPPNAMNFVAFAYINAGSGSNLPAIADVTYSKGVPVAQNGSFRIADLPPATPAYRIGVWYNASGNGRIGPGDYFGSVGPCNVSSSCTSLAQSIVVAPVSARFGL